MCTPAWFMNWYYRAFYVDTDRARSLLINSPRLTIIISHDETLTLLLDRDSFFFYFPFHFKWKLILKTWCFAVHLFICARFFSIILSECQRLEVKFYAKWLRSKTSLQTMKKKLRIRHFHGIKKFLKRGLSFQARSSFVVYSNHKLPKYPGRELTMVTASIIIFFSYSPGFIYSYLWQMNFWAKCRRLSYQLLLFLIRRPTKINFHFIHSSLCCWVLSVENNAAKTLAL